MTDEDTRAAWLAVWLLVSAGLWVGIIYGIHYLGERLVWA